MGGTARTRRRLLVLAALLGCALSCAGNGNGSGNGNGNGNGTGTGKAKVTLTIRNVP
jgi:hypothetical protein